MRVRSICLAVVVAALAIVVPVARADTFVVDSTGDGDDCNLAISAATHGRGAQCTLRAAIQQSNATAPTAPRPRTRSTSRSVRGDDPGALRPRRRHSRRTRRSTAARARRRRRRASGCAPRAPRTGLDVDATGVTVRGLAISNFETGVLAAAAGLILRNSDLGVRVDHTTVEGMDTGVLVSADGARIGCNATPRRARADRNVFAGNGTGLSIIGGDCGRGLRQPLRRAAKRNRLRQRPRDRRSPGCRSRTTPRSGP